MLAVFNSLSAVDAVRKHPEALGAKPLQLDHNTAGAELMMAATPRGSKQRGEESGGDKVVQRQQPGEKTPGETPMKRVQP